MKSSWQPRARARVRVRARQALAATLAPLAALAGLAVIGGAAAPAGAATGGSISLVAYSTPKPAYAALITAFEATKAGQGVSFSQSFGASGSQATAVVDGLPADVVNFSLTPDMTKLVKAGIVSPSWNKNATKGFVTNSIVSFVVRKGNPKHITTWNDLVKSGVTVITPNPFSSGSAKWNLMAAYGAQLNQGKSKAAATAYLTQLLKHTAAQPSSASNALQTFLAGQGDVLLDYEDDALYAQSQGEPVTVITPPQTILIQNPIAVSAKASNPTVAKAFTAFLLSPAGQKIWGKQGYRPVLASVAATFNFPKPKTLFTIDSLGGWTAVNLKFFDPQTGVIANIEQGLGVSTASG
ncbi:MAG TPA: sulfate ABC transporter substrate-binding protein [Acidimicrobiales bacterium]|jgi:sulfate/thiosulfate-binding protein|nr:sulfate ABC transporter substrate-binding protein [Acidimicrobiales bacterium]